MVRRLGCVFFFIMTTLVTPLVDPRFTPAMQREAAGPMLELLRAERSQLVKEAVGATCAVAEHMGRDLATFAVAVFKDLVAATGAGSPVPRKHDSSAIYSVSAHLPLAAGNKTNTQHVLSAVMVLASCWCVAGNDGGHMCPPLVLQVAP